MKKTDAPVIIVVGDNNKVQTGDCKSRLPAAIAIALSVIVGAALLAVSLCCPELFTDFVRSIISITVGG